MKHVLLTFILGFLPLFLFASKITEIKGYAPNYVGKQIEVFQILDFLSMRQERIASATVKEDSTFSCSFYLDETQKLVLASNNNKAYIFADPGATYSILLPDRNKFDPYRPAGNFVELTFFDLPETDINYKILEFNRWTDEFVATYYTKNNASSVYFSKRLDTFKLDVTSYYKTDTLNDYFNYHRKFSLGKLDDLRFIGSRNQYEKYDQYLHFTKVKTTNEAYMNYVIHFYDKLLPRINKDVNNSFYLALLKSSPSLIFNSLQKEYTTQHNYKLRELVMIQTLSQVYYDKDFPQTNIITVLDSVSKFGLFEENRLVAKNVLFRLNEVTPGAKAADFSVLTDGKMQNLESFKGKPLYLFFVDPNSLECRKQMELLVPIFRRYESSIQFLMVLRKDEGTKPDDLKWFQDNLPWKSTVVDKEHVILKSYNVQTVPYYTLIDPTGYIVAAPALGPTPNGQYETIDKIFYSIKLLTEEQEKDKR